MDRNGEAKRASAAGRTVRPDPPAVCLNNAPGDVEAESYTAAVILDDLNELHKDRL
jgi:hypothetical protein